jgi:hypothetical protein
LDFEELANLFFVVGRGADHFGLLVVEEHGGSTPLDGTATAPEPQSENGTGLYL